MYLDVDRKHHKFMIRDSFTQEIRYNIPEWLMEFHEDEFMNVALRFTWIDNETVKIVNPEGIERLVDLKNNFKEIEFNRIPLYDPTWTGPEHCRHYYLDPPPPEHHNQSSHFTFDTLERLKRKYQHYKSAYFLDKKRDMNALYSVLHTVDYDVKETKERYCADLSFTFLHWNLIEQLEEEKI